MKQSCRGIKIGDKVKIVQKAKTHENGWEDSWEPKMDIYVGTVHRVNGIYGTDIGLDDTGGYYFPWFVLEVVK